MKPDTAVSVVLCTCPPPEAERLATTIVKSGHAACVNILPAVNSIYRWKGKLEKATESLLVIKCPADRVDELTAAIRAAHPYDVPEVVALPVASGNDAYLRWVVDESRADG